MDPLSISFDGVRDKNVEQLKVLNRAIFPINYSDTVYADILACADVSQLAYHNDVCVGAIACRLEREPEVRRGGRARCAVGKQMQGKQRQGPPRPRAAPHSPCAPPPAAAARSRRE